MARGDIMIFSGEDLFDLCIDFGLKVVVVVNCY